MSHPSRVGRSFVAAASSLLIACAFANTASANVTGSRTATCTMPTTYPAQQSTNLQFDLGFPANPVAGETLKNAPASATLSMPNYTTPKTFVAGPAWFEGTIKIDLLYQVASVNGGLPIAQTTATLAIPKTDFPKPSPLVATAAGTLSDVTFDRPGAKKLWFGGYTLNLTAHYADGTVAQFPSPGTDSDGDPDTFDVPCNGGWGDLPFAQVDVVAGTTPTPAPATPGPTTPAPATPTPVPGTCAGTTAAYSYNLQGSTSINTLTKGSMPLTGKIDAELCVADGNYTATTTLNDTQGRLTALGFLPVTVTVGIVPSGPTTGQLVDDQITANLKARIKVKSVKVFGAIPIAGGNDCQTKNLSSISLKSTDSFDPTDRGGNIGGTFAIGDLNGCGFLGGIVSPLTAGSGNTIAAKLTPINN